LNSAQVGKIREALDFMGKDMKTDESVKEVHSLITFKESHRNTNVQGGQDRDSDDEDLQGGQRGGQNVKCAQQ
jgi:hypothetical protein